MLQDYNVRIEDFIRMTASGVQVASFVQIRAALIERYKAVYGDDIDLSTGTADGVFVNDLALIINNILQAMQTMYANLNVNTATGVYLDALCALSNVTRKQATNSIASIEVENPSTNALTFDNGLTFIDKSGVEWEYSKPITFPGKTGMNAVKTQLNVICKEVGPIKAPAGWIYETIDVTDLVVTQPNAAEVGSSIESDASLRARRSQSSGAAGLTVLDSLAGALLNVAGIEDVKIYNNNVNHSSDAEDGTSIAPHSIYVVIRQRQNVEIANETIGSIIHSKLTPGIRSCESNGVAGEVKSYVYVTEIAGLTVAESEQTIYWKRATPINPQIDIKVKPFDYFSESEFASIAQHLIDYMNSLQLGEIATSTELLIETVAADPKFKGKPTYTVLDVDVSDEQYDTFYNYSAFDATYKEATLTEEAHWVLTIK